MAEITTEVKDNNGVEMKEMGFLAERNKDLNLSISNNNKVIKEGFELKGSKVLFKAGNTLGKGRPKGTFSIRQDLIKSLKQIKRKNPKLYQEIIASYWQDTKLRPFLLEIIDGKARQQVDFGGNMSNPIRIIEVRANIEQNEAKT